MQRLQYKASYYLYLAKVATKAFEFSWNLLCQIVRPHLFWSHHWESSHWETPEPMPENLRSRVHLSKEEIVYRLIRFGQIQGLILIAEFGCMGHCRLLTTTNMVSTHPVAVIDLIQWDIRAQWPTGSSGLAMPKRCLNRSVLSFSTSLCKRVPYPAARITAFMLEAKSNRKVCPWRLANKLTRW